MTRDEARAEVRQRREYLDRASALEATRYAELYEAITAAADAGVTYPELAQDAKFSRGRIAQVIAACRAKRQAS